MTKRFDAALPIPFVDTDEISLQKARRNVLSPIALSYAVEYT